MDTIAGYIIKMLKRILPTGLEYRKLLFGPAAGCVMLLDYQQHLRAVFGLYEYELLIHLKRMVQPGSKCFDVGGKDGYDALMVAKLSNNRVICFECDDRASSQMRETFQRNPRLTINVVEAFVGNCGGHGCITLDRASGEYFIPSFIKIDIEGAEVDALVGAKELLTKHRPHFIIEVHGIDKEEGCISILRQHGYEVTIVNQGTFLKDKSRSGHNRWLVAYASDS